MAHHLESPNGTSVYLSGAPEYKLSANYIQDPPVDCTYIFANHCDISLSLIETREFHLHVASLAVIDPNASLSSSGRDGDTNVTMLDKHANGTNAYPIWLSAAKFEKFNTMWIKATGGNGGKGYSSPDNDTPAGVGGSGGNGADVHILVDTVFDLLADRASEVISDTTRQSAGKIDDMMAWAQFAQLMSEPNAPDGISWVFVTKVDQSQPDMDAEGPLPHAINATTFLALMKNTVGTLAQMSEEYLSAVKCDAGNGGHGGGTPDLLNTGPEGQPGIAGASRRSRLSVTEILACEELLFHPDQVALTIKDIENGYYIGTEASIQAANVKLQVLTDRLSFLDKISPTDKLYQAYAKNEFSVLGVLPTNSRSAPTSIISLKNSLQLARNYMANIAQGLDFYRHAGTWVPRGSYKFQESLLEQVLSDFSDIESNYFAYQKLADDKKQRDDQVQKAHYAADRGAALATADMKRIGDELSETAGQIADLQDEVPRKFMIVNKELQKLSDRIRTNVEMPSMKDFLGAATMMAFSEGMPMAAIQGATLLNGSVTQVKNQMGDAVDKDYVVEQIHKLAGGLQGLKEGIELGPSDPNITVNDPGAIKLLGQQSDIMDLVSQYKDALGDDLDDFKNMFDDFVNTVIQRNNQVIHYNTLITVFLETRTKYATFKATKATLGAEEASSLNSQIPALSAVVQSSYLGYTSRVLNLLYDTQRALTFLSLNHGTVDLTNLRDEGFPSNGLGARLKAAKADLIADYSDTINGLSNGRHPFGTTAGLGGQAMRVDLSEWQLKALKTKLSRTSDEYFTTISVPVATKQTSIETSVFAGNADVRISNVRVYLQGATTADGILRVTIQQQGDETMITVHNEQRRYTHDRLVFPFNYSLNTGAIVEDGDLGLQDGDYALPGPFATWRIGVSTLNNRTLDLSGVTKAWVEFSGWSRSFR